MYIEWKRFFIVAHANKVEFIRLFRNIMKLISDIEANVFKVKSTQSETGNLLFEVFEVYLKYRIMFSDML